MKLFDKILGKKDDEKNQVKKSMNKNVNDFTGENNVEAKESIKVENNDNLNKENKKMMNIIDQHGRRVQISMNEWREKVLPIAIKKHWDNPSQLYNDVIKAIQNDLQNDVLEAALHLKEIDTIKERGYNTLAILHLKNKDFNSAQTILLEYLEENEKTGTILTNLAKCYYGKGEEEKGIEILWEGLNINPNQNNGLPWYASIFREKEGMEAFKDALIRASKIDKSWLPQVLLAREELKVKNIEEAKRLYKEALSEGHVSQEALLVISGELGAKGLSRELIELIEPVYDFNKNDIRVGLNLLQAYLQNKETEKGEILLNKLMKLERPELKKLLLKISSDFDKIKIERKASKPNADIKINMMILDNPVWTYGIKPSPWMISEKKEDVKIAILPYADETIREKEIKGYQKDNDTSMLSRGIPLYISEVIQYYTNYSNKVILPFIKDFGPVITNKQYNNEALDDLGKKINADLVISGSVMNADIGYLVKNTIYNMKDKTSKSVEMFIQKDNFGARFNSMINELKTVLQGNNESNNSLYRLANDKEVFHYLSSLGHSLTQTLIHGKFVDKDLLLGERNMINWYLNMAIAYPENEAIKMLLVSGLVKSKEYGSNVYLEFKKQTLAVLVGDKNEEAKKRLIPIIYRVYGMEKELDVLKEKLIKDCNDEEYIEWLKKV